MAVIDIHRDGQKVTVKEAMNLLAFAKEAINLLAQPVRWTMEKADIVTAIVNVTEKFAQETMNIACAACAQECAESGGAPTNRC